MCEIIKLINPQIASVCTVLSKVRKGDYTSYSISNVPPKLYTYIYADNGTLLILFGEESHKQY